MNPSVRIYLRAYDRIDEISLLGTEPDGIVRETFESSVKLASIALEDIGYSAREVRDMLEEFRQRDRDRLVMQKADGPEAGRELMQQPLRDAHLMDEDDDQPGNDNDEAPAKIPAE